jgi:hypothetical protein
VDLCPIKLEGIILVNFSVIQAKDEVPE